MNRNSVIKALFAISMVLLLAALPFVSACAPEEKPPEVVPPKPEVAPAKPEAVVGKEVKVVRVAGLTDLSGPMALTTGPFHKGHQEYVRYFNEEIGPQYGLEIEYEWIDHGFVMGRVISGFKRLEGMGCVVFTAMESGTGEVVLPLMEKYQIPACTSAGTLMAAGLEGWHFTYMPTYSDLFGAWIDWVMEERWDKPYPPKFAWLTWDNAMGREPIKPGNRYMREKYGIEVVATEWLPVAPLDVTPQLLRIKEAGADLVFSNIICAPQAVILKDAMRLGLHGEIIFGTNFCGIDPAIIGLAGEASEGLSSPMPNPMPGDDSPMQLLIKKWYREWYGTEDFEPLALYLSGVQEMHVCLEGIRKAFVDEGYPVTGLAVRRGFESMKDFDMLLDGVTASFSPTERRPFLACQIAEIRGGERHNLTGWIPCPDIFGKE